MLYENVIITLDNSYITTLCPYCQDIHEGIPSDMCIFVNNKQIKKRFEIRTSLYLLYKAIILR